MVLELEWDDVVELFILALSAIMAFIAGRAYLRTRTHRVLFFAGAFAAYFFKGVASALEVLFFEDSGLLNGLELVFEASALLLFFLGVVKR